MKRTRKLALLVLTLAALISIWLHRRGDDRDLGSPSERRSTRAFSRAAEVTPAVSNTPPAAPAKAAAALAPGSGDAVVRGIVVDVSGGVVVGASIVAQGSSKVAPLGFTVSDSTGAFELRVPAGEVELDASADGYASTRQIVLAPARDVSIGLVAGSVIAGRVIRQDTRQPVAEVTVTASNLDGLRARSVTVRSDAAGEFRVPGLPAGTYSLEAVGPRWRSKAHSIALDVAATSDHVQLTVLPATSLDARVQVGGKPCPSGHLDLDGPCHSSHSLPEDGRVHVDGLLPGLYRATITCSGAEQNPWTDDLPVASEAMTREWNLLPSQEASAEGTGEKTCCKRVASIQVTLVAPEADAAAVTALALGTTGTPVRGTRVGNRIAFERLSLGRYHVYLEQAPHVRQVVELTTDDQAVQVALEVPIVGEISGRVLDRRGVPVPDTWVRAANPTAVADAPLPPALTGMQGDFVIRGRLAGSYALRVESASGWAEVSSVSAGARDVLLRLGDPEVALPDCSEGTSACPQ